MPILFDLVASVDTPTNPRFIPGQKVKCVKVDNETRGVGPALELKVYTIQEFNTPEECAKRFPDKAYWQENGGRVMLQEMPGLEWFARRFEVVAD